MKRARRKVAQILFAGFLIVPFSKPALSQEPPKQQTNVDENQLRSFAKVYVEVEKIQQSYEPRLQEAPSPQESKQIQQEAVKKVQAALTKQGLTQENVKQILEVARADEGLRKRLLQMIVEERSKS